MIYLVDHVERKVTIYDSNQILDKAMLQRYNKMSYRIEHERSDTGFYVNNYSGYQGQHFDIGMMARNINNLQMTVNRLAGENTILLKRIESLELKMK